MRVFSSIVEPTASFLAFGIPDDLHGGPIRTKTVSYNRDWAAVSLHRLLQECKRSPAIPLLRNEGLKNLTFVIHRSPEVVNLTVDPHENLIQMPAPLGPGPHEC